MNLLYSVANMAAVLLTGLPTGVGDAEAGSSTSEVRSDTIHVAPPTGEKETDRASVQTAFDAVQSGGTVLFSPGTYVLGAGVKLTVPDVTVLGHPEGTVLRGCDPETFAVDGFDRSQIVTAVFGCNGFYIQTERQTIRSLTFEYIWHGIVVGPYQTTMEEPSPASYPAGGQRIEENTFRAAANGLRVLGTGEELSIIRDNDFVDVFHAIGIYGAPLHFLENRISVEEPGRIPISRHPGSAIVVSAWETDCSGHIVAGNRLEGYPGAIYILANRGLTCRAVEIRDNTIEVHRVKVPEAWIGATPTAEDSTMVGVPITLNSINEPVPWMPDAQTEGVIENIVIEGNRLIGAEGLGILVHGSRNRISGNTITAIQRRRPFPGNTWMPGGDPTTWEVANGSAIWVAPGSDGNQILGNTFNGIAAFAVFIGGNDNEVELWSVDDTVRDMGSRNRVAQQPARR